MNDAIIIAAFLLLALVIALLTAWGVYWYQRARACEREHGGKP